MKKQIELKNGKVLYIPARAYRKNDLENMGIMFVENMIYFNKSGKDKSIPEVKSEIKSSMCILDYPDCSDEFFSKKALIRAVKKQENSDFIILPKFKNENEYDISQKLLLAKELKSHFIDKEIILEVSYKVDVMSMKKIISSSDSFDILSLFYGVHYGQYPSFDILCQKIFIFKQKMDKRIICSGVPLMFSGDRAIRYSNLMPVWELISDGFIKCWNRGGDAKEIRLVDFKDLRNKNLSGWLENHNPDDTISLVGISVFSLFQDNEEMQRVRTLYTRMLIDNILNEISSLDPDSLWGYISKNVPSLYHTLILRLYNQRLIQETIRESNWIELYSKEDITLLENHLMLELSPMAIADKFKKIASIIKREKKIPISILIDAIGKT